MAYDQIYWEDVQDGQDLPVMTVDVTYKMAILHVAGGWDYMPGHHQPSYALEQGVKDIFLNTLFHQSMVDRTVTDWAGPQTFMLRRKIAMRGQIYPGDQIEGRAKVTRVWRGPEGDGRVDIAVVIHDAGEDVCVGDCTIRLPDRITAE